MIARDNGREKLFDFEFGFTISKFIVPGVKFEIESISEIRPRLNNMPRKLNHIPGYRKITGGLSTEPSGMYVNGAG